MVMTGRQGSKRGGGEAANPSAVLLLPPGRRRRPFDQARASRGRTAEEIVRMKPVVPLIASCTEIVCALGGEDRSVGCSHECDDPPSIRRLLVCTSR